MASHTFVELRRRDLLGGLASLPLAGPALAAMAKPGFAVPNGACDCHHHIYDGRAAYAPTAVLKPPPATTADYRAYQRAAGLSRSIVVTPSSYAFNNAPTQDFLKAQAGRSIGVAVVPVDVSDATLKSLHAAGFRGVRVQSGAGNPLTPAAMAPLAAKIAPLGWHMQLNLAPALYVEHQAAIRALAVPVVIDHMAQIPGQEGLKSPAYTAMRRILDGGKAWVKISGADAGSQSGPPAYADRAAIAKALIAAVPERCLWGSNWPFPSSAPTAKPDPVQLLDLFGHWVTDARLRQRILVENPERAYGFDPGNRPKPPTI